MMTKNPSMKQVEAKLEQIQRKLWMHQSLTPQEANLVANLTAQQHLQTKGAISLEDDKVVVKRSNNVEPIFDGVKALSETLSETHSGAAGARYVGSIDPITATNWSKEWGCAIGTKEFAKLASQRIKHDRDYHRFKFRG